MKVSGKLGCAAFVLLAISCKKAVNTHTEADYHRQVDSILKERQPDIIRQFDTDLDRRMSIEVRPIADSLSR